VIHSRGNDASVRWLGREMIQTLLNVRDGVGREGRDGMRGTHGRGSHERVDELETEVGIDSMREKHRDGVKET
jgi:hypothetical protein